MPARSNASQAVSRSSRCCGSMARASRGEMPKKAGVELGGVVQEAALAGVAGAGRVGVGVVERVDVPAAVGGERGDGVACRRRRAATGPRGCVRRRGSGSSSPTMAMGSSARRRASAARRCRRRGAGAAEELSQRGRRRGRRGRVVEDQGGGQRRPVAAASRLRSSTAVSESKPSSRKARAGSTASAPGSRARRPPAVAHEVEAGAPARAVRERGEPGGPLGAGVAAVPRRPRCRLPGRRARAAPRAGRR